MFRRPFSSAGPIGQRVSICSSNEAGISPNHHFLKIFPYFPRGAIYRKFRLNRFHLSHDGSMGRTVYLPTWMVDFYGKCYGKYTSPMDPMGIGEIGSHRIHVWYIYHKCYGKYTSPMDPMGLLWITSKLPSIIEHRIPNNQKFSNILNPIKLLCNLNLDPDFC